MLDISSWKQILLKCSNLKLSWSLLKYNNEILDVNLLAPAWRNAKKYLIFPILWVECYTKLSEFLDWNALLNAWHIVKKIIFKKKFRYKGWNVRCDEM